MAMLSIITAPDPRLKKVSTPITKFDDTLVQFCDDMLETIYKSNGVGLAAIQVGVQKRLMVIDLQQDDDHDDRPSDFYPIVMINPEIIDTSDNKAAYMEACLSVPDTRVEVLRPDAVDITYLDQYGKTHSLSQQQTKGWLARCIQHELDHLDGITLLQHLSFLKREVAIKKLKKIKAAL